MSCGRRFFRHAGAQPLLDGGEEDERRHVRAVGDEVSVQRADVVEQSLGRARRRRAAGGAAAPELRKDVCTLGQQVRLQLLDELLILILSRGPMASWNHRVHPLPILSH